jgi:hypothetical protein
MEKLDSLQIMTLVASHAGEEHFEADLKLYKKLFPESPALAALENAEQWQKKALDERMLFEILNAVDAQVFLGNRAGKTADPHEKDLEAADRAIRFLAECDLKEVPYKLKAKLIKDLGIQLPDAKNATITPALEEMQATLRTTAEEELAKADLKKKVDELKAKADQDRGPDADPEADKDPDPDAYDKKKEGPG